MCPGEDECTFEKPNVLVVMDYSSSMVGLSSSPNEFPTGSGNTRWQAQLDAVRALVSNTEFTGNMHIGLARFAHDPDTSSDGTTLTNDTSTPPITDGFAIDLGLDDGVDSYLDCNTEDLNGALDALELTPPAPEDSGGGTAGVMGTWTNGALNSALAYIQDVKARHSGDVNRQYRVILMTDGAWNCAESFTQTDCDDASDAQGNQNPTQGAAALLADGTEVYVVGFADAADSSPLDAVAAAGGTGSAIDATSPEMLEAALDSVLQQVTEEIVVPQCISGLPRVMIIMDASSSMLVGTNPGDSNWDQARYALAGNPDAPNPGDAGYVEPIFDKQVTLNDGQLVTIEDVVHIGMTAYNLQNTQELMLQYAPCARDNLQWAMDPWTSCGPGGDCVNPYTDNDPISWDFKDSAVDPVIINGMTVAPFAQRTMSFMPSCNGGGSERCLGSTPNTYTGEGLAFASGNITSYNNTPAPFVVDPDTPFVNILITDGQTSSGSTSPTGTNGILDTMVQNGILTYVIGFGTPGGGQGQLDVGALNDYADWGGTGVGDGGPDALIVSPGSGGAANLADAIAMIIGGLNLDPCCQLNDCSVQPEPPLPFCGNGVVDAGESCDLGAANGGYDSDGVGGAASCDLTCTIAQGPYCDDGVINGPENCDDGINNGAYGGCLADCSSRAPYCGDTTVNGPETCDDGNDVNDDACRNDCTSCGDGSVDTAAGEECDETTNDGSYGGCNDNCTRAAYCGDGKLDAAYETCDDGINDNSYGSCYSDCTPGPRCGDGAVNGGETCDDGNDVDDDGCRNTCTACGDGVIDSGESCDDGTNDGSYGGCNSDCTNAARCGDGNLDSGNEQCDDGNNVASDGCSATCTTETTNTDAGTTTTDAGTTTTDAGTAGADAGMTPTDMSTAGSGGAMSPPQAGSGSGDPALNMTGTGAAGAGGALGPDGLPLMRTQSGSGGDDGCGCSVPGAAPKTGSSNRNAALGALLLGALLQRRRRRS
ncbi:MAG: DUF4215 domain-containing protein [Myxococcales bacterium]|nr:DUF4215 domain-containing protein [Myxococcales bacterium]